MNMKPTIQIIVLALLSVLVVFNLLIYLDLRESVNLLEENQQLEYQLAKEQEATLQELSTVLQENHELALEQSATLSSLFDAVTSTMSIDELMDFAIQSFDAEATHSPAGEIITTASGLQYQVIASGSGASASAGDTAVVHYTGWLEDGTKFDSSVDRGQPFEFQVGAGNVIQGWDEAVALMQVGDKWKLTIPADLAYGERSVGGGLIPPNSTLIFDVELLDLK